MTLRTRPAGSRTTTCPMLTACWTQSRRRWATDMTAFRHSVFEFRLPDVGEGLEEAEIVEWKVSVGQQIAVNQVVVEIETAKSLVELPSPFAGTVLELLSSVGQAVLVGTPIIRIRLDEPRTADGKAVELSSERTEILVGSGPRSGEG